MNKFQGINNELVTILLYTIQVLTYTALWNWGCLPFSGWANYWYEFVCELTISELSRILLVYLRPTYIIMYIRLLLFIYRDSLCTGGINIRYYRQRIEFDRVVMSQLATPSLSQLHKQHTQLNLETRSTMPNRSVVSVCIVPVFRNRWSLELENTILLFGCGT